MDRLSWEEASYQITHAAHKHEASKQPAVVGHFGYKILPPSHIPSSFHSSCESCSMQNIYIHTHSERMHASKQLESTKTTTYTATEAPWRLLWVMEDGP